MDSVLDDFCQQVIEFRHRERLQPGQLQRVAQHVRDVVQPQLAQREALLVENAELKKEVAALRKKTAA